ncbi:uncharacterized protein L203_104517 [Cryptococcus depauperatus CBS 7841]|uniref:Uncharacterized protein n=1 Tax=Cryptococcus depauperatus CBS 7841 TaxID=1295531 RepID=A0A1E3INR7_9TREE|nr:adenine nucleotide transporter [Cryptococcus depauperatus CBS 7841]
MALTHPPLTPFGSALAGALGSVFANSIVYPLDIAKTRLQAMEDPLKGAELDDEDNEARRLKTAEEQKSINKGEVRRQQTREKIDRIKKVLGKRLKRWSVLTMLLRIFQTEGIRGAFHGFGATMVGTFSQQFAYFFFHTFLRKSYMSRRSSTLKNSSLSTSTELLLGALAGALAQIFTIPVSVIATRQQLWDPPALPTINKRDEKSLKDRSPSLFETAHEIITESGYTGLWTGLKPSLVLTVNPAITYGAFERLKSWRLSAEGRKKLGVAESFWLGMGSKTLATIVTYPYIFAKVRLQAKPTESPPPLAEEIQKGEVPSYADIASTAPAEGSTVIVEHSENQNSFQHKDGCDFGHHHKHSHSPALHHKAAIPLLKAVYKEKGILGVYQGLGAQIIKAVLCQGILFVSKDQFENYSWLLILLFSRLKSQIMTRRARAGVLAGPRHLLSKA